MRGKSRAKWDDETRIALRLGAAWLLFLLMALASGCTQQGGAAIRKGLESVALQVPRPGVTATAVPLKVLRAQYFTDVGKLETRLGAYQAAISAFETALELDPNNEEAKRALEDARRAAAQATPVPPPIATPTPTPISLFIPPPFLPSPIPEPTPTTAPTPTATPPPTASPTPAPLGCLGDEKMAFEPATAGIGDRVIVSVASARGHLNIRLAAPGPAEFLGVKQGATGYIWEWSTTPTAKGSFNYFFYVDYNTLCASGTLTVVGRWQPLSSGLPRPEDFRITGIGVSPNLPFDKTLFLAFDGQGVFKSTDADAPTPTFGPVNTGLTNLGVLSLALSPDYGRDATVFVGTKEGFVFRSTDGGQNWVRLALPPGVVGDVTAVAISPNFATDGTLFAGVDGRGVFISPNKGDSWSPMDDGLNDRSVQALAISADYANDGILFAGTRFSGTYRFAPPVPGQPLFFSPRPAANIIPKACLISAVPAAGPGTPVPAPERLRCLSIAVIAGSAPDKQTHFITKPGFVTYTYVVINDEGKGPILDIEIRDDNGTPGDPSDDVVVGRVAQLNVGEAKVFTKRFYVTKDRTSIATGTAKGEINGRMELLTAMDDALVDVPEWSPINTGLQDLWVRTLAISPFFANDRSIFAGSAFGGLFKHDGKEWRQVSGGLAEKWDWAYSVALSPRFQHEPTVYVGTRGGVYRTTDGGNTWVFMSVGLPDISKVPDPNRGVRALAISPDFGNDRTVFSGVWLDNIYRARD